jgi:hypothetical protein
MFASGEPASSSHAMQLLAKAELSSKMKMRPDLIMLKVGISNFINNLFAATKKTFKCINQKSTHALADGLFTVSDVSGCFCNRTN